MEFEPKFRQSANNGICCVSGCNSKKSWNTRLSFHKLPKEGQIKIKRKNIFGIVETVDKRTEWLKRLKYVKNNKFMFVCSLHFTPDDYCFPDQPAVNRKLKPNSVPMETHVSAEKVKKNIDRKNRFDRRRLARKFDTVGKNKITDSMTSVTTLTTSDRAKRNIMSNENKSTNIFEQESSLEHNVVNCAADYEASLNISHDYEAFADEKCQNIVTKNENENIFEQKSSLEHYDVDCAADYEASLNISHDYEAFADEKCQNIVIKNENIFEQKSSLEHYDVDCEVDCEAAFNTFHNDEAYIDENCQNNEISTTNKVNVKKEIENEILKDQEFQKIGFQVTSGDFTMSLSSFIKTEKELITMCGITSFNILTELSKLMDEIYPAKRKRSLSTCDSIILTTAKLKLDIPFNALAILFSQVSDVTVRNIFYDTVKKLSTILQSTIKRVSNEEILRNMPKCFNNFRDTTSVLDCTEVKIQQPKCLKCQIKFYSHYKGDLTVKFLTEATPAGILTYVSEAFGGRASDKTIFNHSDILQNLESTRDAIMVDKGFLIDEECHQRRVKLIRLPFLKQKNQLSQEEALNNREIACARVHIERMNQRIKQFQILKNRLPWFFINYVDDIFIICCALANLGTPILGDDKF